MASSSSSHPPRKVDESSKLYDVFINHRGPDVKETVALQLYNSLTDLRIPTYLDQKEKELGESFPSTIEKAIGSALVHIAIFSERYAESSWCLDELVLMSKSNSKIIPLFYKVKPFDLRYVEDGKYAEAFTKFKRKQRHTEKHDAWKNALNSASLLTGHEISETFNSSDCQVIVEAVRKEVQRKTILYVAKHPVGLPRLVEDIEKLCHDQIVEDFERNYPTNDGGIKKARIVGIVGMGGAGKTTLAKELFNKKLSEYTRACFLFDVRAAYANDAFASLQMKLVKDLFQKDLPSFQSKEQGTSHIGECIRRSKQLSFLIVLDDIDLMQQLDDLLIMDMLKKSDNSLVIVTTQNAEVLINTRNTIIYNLKAMDGNYASDLFCLHAFGEKHPPEGYEHLVKSFLNECGGLPLSLQVLGSHVHGREQDYWSFELEKVSKKLDRGIHKTLKLSFDGLEYEEQQMFMDIACFFAEQSKGIAMEVWEASGWKGSARHALEKLKNKCLVQEIEERLQVWPRLRMHDLLRRLGRDMADTSSSPRRLWCPGELKRLEPKGFQKILCDSEHRCFHSFSGKPSDGRITYFVGDSRVNCDTSTFLLWLNREFKSKFVIILQNNRCSIIWEMSFETVWLKYLQAPTQLKELQMCNTSLGEKLDLTAISNTLEKLLIYNCSVLLITLSGLTDLIELNISDCNGLEELSIGNMSCLEKIILGKCRSLVTVSGSELRELVELHISECPLYGQLRLIGLNSLERLQVTHSLGPICLELDDCKSLETISGINLQNPEIIDICNCPKLGLPSFQVLRNLKTVTIDGCGLEVLPFQGLRNLKTVTIDGTCGKPKTLLLSRCQNLEGVTIKLGLNCLENITIVGCRKLNCFQLFKYLNLKQVSISGLWELEELPCFARQTCLEKISIVGCEKVQKIFLPTKLVELKIEGCRELKTVAACCDHSECVDIQVLSDVAQLRYLKRITIQRCNKLQFIQGFDEMHAIENLELSNCPELEELPCLSRQTCLEKIAIVRCGKLQNITLPPKLVELLIVGCRELKTVTPCRDHSECLELLELSSVARLSNLKQITIQKCDKLETIQAIDELRALKSLQLSYCSNTAMQNCIPILKCVPSEFMAVIGRAVDGAQSILNPHLFSHADVVIAEIDALRSDKKLVPVGEFSAIIVSVVVVVNSYTPIARINEFLSDCYWSQSVKLDVRQGEWVVTMVTTEQHKRRIYCNYDPQFEDVLLKHGIMKKGYKVAVKKGEEWKIQHVMHAILDRVYQR